MSEDLTRCDKIIMGIMRNNANRATNCDSGNIAKQVRASGTQVKKITDLINSGEIRTLSKKLQETALARVANPDATYEELAELLGITKSGVVNRIKVLMK